MTRCSASIAIVDTSAGIDAARNRSRVGHWRRMNSPPTTGPCFYGVDTPTRRELVASSHSVEEICQYVTADSLAYLSEQGMYAALQEPAGGFCDACFTGRYPVPLGERPKGSQLSLFGEIER